MRREAPSSTDPFTKRTPVGSIFVLCSPTERDSYPGDKGLPPLLFLAHPWKSQSPPFKRGKKETPLSRSPADSHVRGRFPSYKETSAYGQHPLERAYRTPHVPSLFLIAGNTFPSSAQMPQSPAISFFRFPLDEGNSFLPLPR